VQLDVVSVVADMVSMVQPLPQHALQVRWRFLRSILEGDVMTDASESARALAARRKRAVFTCEVCGRQYEAWDRSKQPARTCSGRCRVKLHRDAKRTENGTEP